MGHQGSQTDRHQPHSVRAGYRRSSAPVVSRVRLCLRLSACKRAPTHATCCWASECVRQPGPVSWSGWCSSVSGGASAPRHHTGICELRAAGQPDPGFRVSGQDNDPQSLNIPQACLPCRVMQGAASPVRVAGRCSERQHRAGSQAHAMPSGQRCRSAPTSIQPAPLKL